MSKDSKLFAALLKFWRGKRGLSQLDLALTAEVSARHISFLETGRAHPSQEMILLLASTLDMPLRERNVMLRMAGFPEVFDEPALDALADPGVERAIARMMRQHEPYPMLLMDRWYKVLLMNKGARRLFTLSVKPDMPTTFNAFSAFFDPTLLRPHVVEWEDTAREMISRLHRESLYQPHDTRLAALLEEALQAPGVPEEWRRPDFSRGSNAAFTFRFRIGNKDLGFLTTLTSFSAPQNITLDELQIESYFPLDEATEQVCAMLVE